MATTGSDSGAEHGSRTDPPRRVLIIDDSEQIRTVLSTMLREAAVEVVEAQNGFEGLVHLRRDPAIALVLLDLHMPAMDGLAMLRTLRAELPASKAPIVVMTGDGESAVEAKNLGAVGALLKPIRYEAVLRIARTFLR